ncbi:DUF4956 domain-containing protein [Microbacterium telephonicum]|uniref:Uncharacterized protein DUF4956 n=1 Tax=Microbacterium telephonicum TaxID=1714841 RepID=A0A498CHG4_9MICO|nr:DUF4956 domain-containing protein [Microbacterium telephonicum]RLK52540.1 uncharacterized protein DUF4956 [Microbacterium telephonicum]
MTTSALILFAVDLAAAIILSLGLYYRRHRRRDLVVAFMGVNVGVMAVAAVLGTAEVAMGLGLGLFGVLSIIRLRSSEISQREVAYYFAALAIGLLSGLPQTDPWPVVGLIALMLAVLWAADHPALLARSRHQIVRLDRAVSDEQVLRTELGQRLGGTVTSVTVQELDLVNDTTLVDVRYRIDLARTRRMSRTVTTTTDAAATRARAVQPATAASGAAVVSDSNLAEARR